jgi:hypothetical protein
LKRVFAILSIAFFFSCAGKKKEEKLPSYVLDKEKFSDLICDFTLAEGAVGMNIKSLPGNKMDSVYAFNPLKDNKVTRKDFDTSMYYYCRHPELFKEVYQLALEKMSKFQASRK